MSSYSSPWCLMKGSQHMKPQRPHVLTVQIKQRVIMAFRRGWISRSVVTAGLAGPPEAPHPLRNLFDKLPLRKYLSLHTLLQKQTQSRAGVGACFHRWIAQGELSQTTCWGSAMDKLETRLWRYWTRLLLVRGCGGARGQILFEPPLWRSA